MDNVLERKSMTYKEAVAFEAARRKADKETKYSDERIRELIYNAESQLRHYWDECGAAETAAANTAQAMIAYNRMIDERWDRK